MELEQKNPKLKPKQQHLEWRRNRVLELTSQGRTEREVAQLLNVGNGTIHRDVAYLRKQAQDNLKYHIQERLPEQHQKCSNGLDQVIKMTWDMIIMDSVSQPKLQALSLISDCYRHQMDLVSNGVVITDAIKYVNGKMDHLNKQEKEILQDIKQDNNHDKKEGEETTTNIVF